MRYIVGLVLSQVDACLSGQVRCQPGLQASCVLEYSTCTSMIIILLHARYTVAHEDKITEH